MAKAISARVLRCRGHQCCPLVAVFLLSLATGCSCANKPEDIKDLPVESPVSNRDVDVVSEVPPLQLVGEPGDIGPGPRFLEMKGIAREADPLVLKNANIYLFDTVADGSRFLTCLPGERDACYWELATGKQIHLFRHPEILADGKISPNSQYLVTITAGKDSPARLWNLESAEMIREIESPCVTNACPTDETDHSILRYGPSRVSKNLSCGFTAINFSPDSEFIVAGTAHGDVDCWETETGKEVFRIKAREITEPILQIWYYPDSNRVLTRSRSVLYRIWDTASHQVIDTYKPMDDPEVQRALELKKERLGMPINWGAHIPIAINDQYFAYYLHCVTKLEVRATKTGRLVRCWKAAAKHHVVGAEFFLPDNKYLMVGDVLGRFLALINIETGQMTRRRNCGTTRRPALRYFPKTDIVMRIWDANGEETLHQDWTSVDVFRLSQFEIPR